MSGGGIMIAATQSGVGKTSVSIALARSLMRRGLKVAAFKVGPDFLDPTYLFIAAGGQCHNLDGWMMGCEYAKDLFAKKSGEADISLIEGAMGLFDGAATNSIEGSSAEIAALTGVPVLLVVGAHGMARSIAPLVKGFADFDKRVSVKGVIANMAGSKSHAKLLADSLMSAGLPPLVGALPRGAFSELPSRHLGLVSADGNILDNDLMDAMADALEENVDIDMIVRIAQGADENVFDKGINERSSKQTGGHERLMLGIARDEAFHFYYADTLESLEDSGFELVDFSPLIDKELPGNLSGLYFGGGYPESHAVALSSNIGMIESVKVFASSGKPVYAECGGLMYLSQYIRLLDDSKSRMCGVLPFGVRMLEKRKMLGYVEARLEEDSLWGAVGTVFRGHEFHYSEPEVDIVDGGEWRKIYSLKTRRTGEVAAEGYTNGNVLAAYPHLHFASSPGAVKAFHDKCAAGCSVAI